MSIVSLGDDFESDKALLQHLSDSPINHYVPDQDPGASAYTGSNRQYSSNLKLGYLGVVGPKRWIIADDALDVDWHFCVFSTTSGTGIDDAA
ncbi:hypothetical protein PENSUB_12312 [Penicillium subrubescens]|uniref:Uncharacterized protein n=1 Tax=Penicillium subrubescens TaxID=1316194 RepID=A0A1Q5SZ02_9EURO|nr:hypothetical protein PENSUB_12312 [Penicillium subrubescens]